MQKSELDLPWPKHKQAVYVVSRAIKVIKSGVKRLTVIMPFQSGKTSFVQALIELLGVMGNNRIVYLCSYSRKNYKTQIKNDLRVFESNECMIYVGRDIPKYKPQLGDIVVIDEAGYGVSENQLLDKTLQRGLDAVGATVIALSATPYEALKSKWSDAVVYPSKASLRKYYGIWDMFDKGCVKQARPILTSGEDQAITPWFQTILDKMPPCSYGLVRVRTKEEAHRLQGKLLEQNIVSDVWIQGAALSAPVSDIMKIKPRRKRIFIVVEHLRMGERISNKYLDFVVDRLPQTICQNNTVTQSFLGRCCGWDKIPGRTTIYTSVSEARAYANMWEELWNEGVVTTMLDRGNATRNFTGSDKIYDAIDASVRIVRGKKNLPKAVADSLKWGVVKSRGNKHNARSGWVIREEAMGKGIVETKSYFGSNAVSEGNRRKVIEALRAIKENNGIMHDFAQFSKRHKNKDKVSDYAVFSIQTNELYREHGVKKGDFILLTRQGEKYMRHSNTVEVKTCLFTNMVGDTDERERN